MDMNNELEIKKAKLQSRKGCLYWIIFFALIIGTPIIVFLGWFIYGVVFKETKLKVSYSPDELHKIEIVEKGEPAFFGPSSVRLKYKSENFDTSLSNDGAALDSSNVEVSWKNNEEATIKLDGDEQVPEVINFKVPDNNDSQPFKVEYIELGYIPAYTQQDPYGDYAIQIRKSTYSKGSEQRYNFEAPVRVYYGPKAKDSELKSYKEWNISKLSVRDEFKLYWNTNYVFIDVIGENDNGTTYVKDSLKITFN